MKIEVGENNVRFKNKNKNASHKQRYFSSPKMKRVHGKRMHLLEKETNKTVFEIYIKHY